MGERKISKEEFLIFELSSDGESYGVRCDKEACGDILIPCVYEMKPVTQVLAHGFEKCLNIESVTILGRNLQTIESYAFRDCNIKEIEIPKSVKRIEKNAFDACRSLREVEFERNSSLEYIGESAFQSCNVLKEIEIPKSVKKIDKNAFKFCSWMGNITFEQESSLEFIGDYAFYNGSKIENLVIPKSVKYIGENAFSSYGGNRFMESVVFEENSALKHIGCDAFQKCYKLKFNEYEDVLYLGTNSNPYFILMKAKDKELESCIVNDDTCIIAGGAFRNCEELEILELNEKLKSIGENAFTDCGIRKLIVPSSIESVALNAFKESSLREIEFEENEFIEEIFRSCVEGGLLAENLDGARYTKYEDCWYVGSAENPYLLLLSADGFDKTTYKIHKDTKILGNASFFELFKLGEVELPDGLKIVGLFAFLKCKAIKEIVIPFSVEIVDSWAFEGRDTVIYCEAEEKPNMWEEDWLFELENNNVVWGYKK